MAQPLPKHRSREYETIFIVHPETTTETIEHVAGRVTDVISRLDGKLIRAENWGKRRLAYPVKKQGQGFYLYLRYLGYSDMVHEIERNFRMIEPVIKYLTVKIDEDVDPAARPVNEADISFVPMVEEVPEPESRHLIDESDEYTDDDDIDDDMRDDDDDDDDETIMNRKHNRASALKPRISAGAAEDAADIEEGADQATPADGDDASEIGESPEKADIEED